MDFIGDGVPTEGTPPENTKVRVFGVNGLRAVGFPTEVEAKTSSQSKNPEKNVRVDGNVGMVSDP